MAIFLAILSSIFFITVHVAVLAETTVSSMEKYMANRMKAIDTNQNYFLGASTKFDNEKERAVNKILMSFKEKEFSEGLKSHGKLFPAAQHFFHAKSDIERSPVFDIIKMLPKGGNLHIHLEAGMNLTFVLNNVAKWNKLYYCVKVDDHLLFRFSDQIPSKACDDDGSSWMPVENLYHRTPRDKSITDWFFGSMSMLPSMPQAIYSDMKSIWDVFENKITTLLSIVSYEEAFKEAYFQVLLDHYNDNVMYVEFRSLLRNIYRLNQTALTPRETLQMCKEITEKFIADFPDFWGVKFIYAPLRFHSPEEVRNFLHASVDLKEEFPEFFSGFDLVGQEDKGILLSNFLPELLEASEKGIKFFLHSGETNWFGTSIDENLVDAILLNSSRLGHAFALYRHPHLYELAKNRSIAVEVCPISNQILKHVEDLRVHPAAAYLREGFPVVVASDDPALWGAAPLSHDWYMAFMAIGGLKADLRFLKQLALNSIRYSAMSLTEKEIALKKWRLGWNKFLDNVIGKYS